ncbi:MAG: type III polyketide synthase [Ferruginibacter sp.]
MSKIISISTAVPGHKHLQDDLFLFADKVYSRDETDSRKLKFLYRHSGISSRYSVIPDFTGPKAAYNFFPKNDTLSPVPTIEERMTYFSEHATALSVEAIEKCIKGHINSSDITHLITVSCTGLSAPGLDLLVMEAMGLPTNIFRSSINFMGCYAAVHAMKMANALSLSDPNANIVIVCTELCTLHFQTEPSVDNLTASLLFADGSAAFLVQHDSQPAKGLVMDNFYSQVSYGGKKDMAWQLSSTGFLMTLTGYVPALIKQDFGALLGNALASAGLQKDEVTHWCIHPGGTKILDAIADVISLEKDKLKNSYDVLNEYGNMSSPTILFVLKRIMEKLQQDGRDAGHIFGAAFGPGLTMETFTAHYA